jgi:hypothetical protein
MTKLSNTKRSLEAIAADIHQVERANIFAIGKLLTEANDACEHGEWLPWLEANFTCWSHDTALNYMTAHQLASKYERVRNLRVPCTTIYALASDLNDPALPAMVEALAKATKGKTKVITVDDAKEAIELVRLRIEFGDRPDATLRALGHIDANVDKEDAWGAAAGAALKKARPATAEAASKIVCNHYRRHLETLYGGALPDGLDEEALKWLDVNHVEPEERKQVLQRLLAASEPLDSDEVHNIVEAVKHLPRIVDDDDQGDEDERSPGLDAKLLDALQVILDHARRPMPISVSGIRSVELIEAANFITGLNEIASASRGDSMAKIIADRTEASSRESQTRREQDEKAKEVATEAAGATGWLHGVPCGAGHVDRKVD